MAATLTWVAPDGGWGWVIAICSIVLHAQSLGLLLSLGVMYVSWLEEFGDGRGVTSWIISIAITMAFTVGPLPAALANLYGFRVVAISGSLLISAGFILSYFATSVAYLVVTIGLIAGTGCCFLYLTAVAVVSVYFNKRRSLAMGIGTSGTGVGVLISGPFLHYLISEYGWRGALLITGAVSLHSCAFGLLIRPLRTVRVCSDDVMEEGDEDVERVEATTQESGVSNKDSISLLQPQSTKDEMAQNEEEKSSQTFLFNGTFPVPIIEEIGNDVTDSTHQSQTSLVVPHSKNSLFHPERQKARSMMKMSHGSTHSVDKARAYSSLRSLGSYAKNPNVLFSFLRYNKDHSSMDSILAKSIKRLGSISLIGTLPCSILEPETTCRSPMTNSDTETSHLQVALVDDTKCDNNSRSRRKSSISSSRDEGDYRNSTSCCSSLGKKIIDAIHHNVELLRDPTFLLFGISNIATNLSYAPPVMYLVDRAVDSGLDKTSGAALVAMNGIGNIIGRLFFGAITYRLLKDRIMTYVAVLALAGVFTSASPICGGSFVLHGIYATIIGSLLGGYCTLVAVTTVDLMGVDKAAGSFGLLLSFFGIGTLLGPPFGGILFDWTKSYTWAYILYGIFLVISALIVLPTACVRRKRRKAEKRKVHGREMGPRDEC